ncbi:hypothetical protein P154DRAFT_416940, partial [Amniculicola lignicola CBS 123094]
PEYNGKFQDIDGYLHTDRVYLPEKCPIRTCAYHVRGFARSIDKVHHACSHFQGTMLCGFCPPDRGRHYTRTDVFARHLRAIHNADK